MKTTFLYNCISKYTFKGKNQDDGWHNPKGVLKKKKKKKKKKN